VTDSSTQDPALLTFEYDALDGTVATARCRRTTMPLAAAGNQVQLSCGTVSNRLSI